MAIPALSGEIDYYTAPTVRDALHMRSEAAESTGKNDNALAAAANTTATKFGPESGL